MNVSFIHAGGPQMASYRYRVEMPAHALSAKINEYPANVLIFAKPQPNEVHLARHAQSENRHVIVDICDNHLAEDHYAELIRLADTVTCPTPAMAELISLCFPDCAPQVVPDAYEFGEVEPHCNGINLLWFGHASNLKTLRRLGLVGVRVVSNVQGTIPWSLETLCEELLRADIVLMPATASYKSPNRTLEAIRMGCFVVAEPHPAIEDFPIWIGDIREGIEWARLNPQKANDMILTAQDFIRKKYSPSIQENAWRTVLAKFA